MTYPNLYPEQLRQIADMCDALNAAFDAETSVENGMGVNFAYGIPIEFEDGGRIGRLIDEVGGAWSFEPSELQDE